MRRVSRWALVAVVVIFLELALLVAIVSHGLLW